MFRLPRASALLTVLALVGSTLYVQALVTPAAAAPDTYTPAAGVRTNNPKGDWAARNRIRHHMIRSINSVPRGGRIRVMSWNIRDKWLTDSLVRAHRWRAVTVQVIMQNDNAFAHQQDASNPIAAPGEANPEFWRMRRALMAYGNSRRSPGRQSWARLCDASCRGGSGIAHTKMVIFDRVYRTPRVVMYGSGNLTKAAATVQWNDLQTLVNNSVLYDHANLRFNEMARDRRMANPYRSAGSRGVMLMFYPWYGVGTTGDPILRFLAPVHCRGTAPGFGTTRGRTIIRVAQTAIGDARGRAIARRLAYLKRVGCNVKVLYGLMGPEVKKILRGSHVPIHQLAVDHDGDWIYDRYLHQKVLTVNGNYGSDESTTLALNGSANMQGYTLRSDELVGRIGGGSMVRHYQRWVDQWFGRSAGRLATSARSMLAEGLVDVDTGATRSDDVDEKAARKAGVDPYAKFEVR